MTIRYFKIILVVFVSLQALLYALQNLANLDGAYQSILYVMSNQEHLAYPNSIGPDITSPILIWFALGVILLGEFGAGILAARGAFAMWKLRKGTAAEFHAAKHCALLGCLISIVVWFGLFMVIAGAFFQMWQTQIGANSLAGAFQYSVLSALVLIYLSMDESE